jgi:CelD/BcsL family acetyltransferase involved in cellulose biosynthesis
VVQVEICRPDELQAADRQVWSSLLRSRPAWESPFLSHAFARIIASRRPNVRVAVLHDGGAACGFFAYEQLRMGMARAVGLGLSDVQGPLMAAGCDVPFSEVLRRCSISVLRCTHLVSLPADAELTVTSIPRPAPWVDLSGGFQAYEAAAPAARRRHVKGIRQRMRKIEREMGSLRFEYGPPGDTVLSQLLAWKVMQYRRTGLATPLSLRSTIEIIHKAAATADPDLTAVGGAVYADDTLLSADLSLRCGGTCAGWLSAYDRAYAGYAPGSIAMYLELEATAADGVTRFELGRGEEAYKARLASDDGQLFDGYLRRRTPVALAHRVSRAPVDAALRTVLGSPRLRGAARRVLSGVGAVRSAVPRLRPAALTPFLTSADAAPDATAR